MSFKKLNPPYHHINNTNVYSSAEWIFVHHQQFIDKHCKLYQWQWRPISVVKDEINILVSEIVERSNINDLQLVMGTFGLNEVLNFADRNQCNEVLFIRENGIRRFYDNNGLNRPLFSEWFKRFSTTRPSVEDMLYRRRQREAQE